MFEDLTKRTIALLVLGAVIVVLAYLGLSECQKRRSADTQARVEHSQGEAAIDSGAEATNTLGNVMANDAATDATVAQGQAEIAAAAKGQKGAAAKRAACRFKAYANSPQCKEQ